MRAKCRTDVVARSVRVLSGLLLVITFGACASYKSTLSNAKGEQITCEASGKSGIITGHYLRQGFEDCVAAAKAKGYTEAPAKP